MKTDKDRKVVETHQYIQQVLKHRSIAQSVKAILIHCLEKHQCRNKDGLPYTFTSSGMQYGTGQARRTVDVGIAELKRHSVLKVCGQIRFDANQDKPRTLYLEPVPEFATTCQR